MKKLVSIFIAFISSQGLSLTTTNFTLSSGYIWRGLPFSSRGGSGAQSLPVLQGSIDYVDPRGWGLNLFVGNTDSTNYSTLVLEADHEIDPTVSYIFNQDSETKIGFLITSYNYLKNDSNNSTDIQSFILYKSLKLELSYMENFFGAKTSSSHIRINHRQEIENGLGYSLALGSSYFDSQSKVGFKNYLDYKLGIYKSSNDFTFEIYLSDTNRKKLDKQDKDDTAIITSLAATFD